MPLKQPDLWRRERGELWSCRVGWRREIGVPGLRWLQLFNKYEDSTGGIFNGSSMDPEIHLLVLQVLYQCWEESPETFE